MDHIEEAKKQPTENLEPWKSAPEDKAVALAQAHALISIAESLAKLAAAVSDSAIDVHEVK